MLKEWESENKKKLSDNGRLCPKIPFVIGGEYGAENLYESTFPHYIGSYANFAKQIKDLPDQTDIQIQTVWLSTLFNYSGW